MDMRWWKILGLAGFAGVAATGVVIARAERRRRAYTPEEIRSRLRDRLAEASATVPPTNASPLSTGGSLSAAPPPSPADARRRIPSLLRALLRNRERRAKGMPLRKR
ncbi:MAG: hypothetical protein JWQ95_147 [Sphaerisporangium sp.]|jgi:hypothetical protein|nr:hypothetical protein [Sphaerisporangium sp.]